MLAHEPEIDSLNTGYKASTGYSGWLRVTAGSRVDAPLPINPPAVPAGFPENEQTVV